MYRRILLAMLVFVVPVVCGAETVFLKDGSAIRGEVMRLDGDTLQVRASFGSVLRIPRAQLLRIDFSDSLQVFAPLPGAGAGARPAPGPPGKLILEFDDVEVSSTITVHRDRDRHAHERENVIELKVTIDGKPVYTVVDSSTDKVIREGPEVLVRNRMTPEPVQLEVASGTHHVTVSIANTRVDQFRDRFDGAPIDFKLRMDGVDVRPGEVTRLTIGFKRGKLGLGGRRLVLIDNRVDGM